MSSSGNPWSDREVGILNAARKKHGDDWAKVLEKLPNRTLSGVRNKAGALDRERLKEAATAARRERALRARITQAPSPSIASSIAKAAVRAAVEPSPSLESVLVVVSPRSTPEVEDSPELEVERERSSKGKGKELAARRKRAVEEMLDLTGLEDTDDDDGEEEVKPVPKKPQLALALPADVEQALKLEEMKAELDYERRKNALSEKRLAAMEKLLSGRS